MTASTVGEELKHNPRLTKSKEDFVQLMNDLGLTKPSKIGNSTNEKASIVGIVSKETGEKALDLLHALRSFKCIS